MTWHYAAKDKSVGPISEAEFQALVKDGTIQPSTLVWNETLPAWQPLSQVQAVSAPASAPAPALPPVWSNLPTGVKAPLLYAGFWIRFGALIIDEIIVAIGNAILSLPFHLLGVAVSHVGGIVFTLLAFFLTVLAHAAYEIVFVTSYGATPGKMVLHLRVVNADGTPVTWQIATGRYFAKYLSAITLCIGYLIAAFDEQKRALHDMICNTRVIYSE